MKLTQWRDVVGAAVTRFGRLDFLLNNAAIGAMPIGRLGRQ